MMMTAVFTVASVLQEGWRSIWKAMRHFKEFPDLIQAVFLIWSLLILWAGIRFLRRIVQTFRRKPDPLPQKSLSA